MKSIHITRKITLQREGHEDVTLEKGHHTVADDVAEHKFVKFHTSSVADAGADTADLQALLEQTRIAAAAEIERLQSSLKTAQDHAAYLQQELAAAQTTIAERDAALAAHAAMTPAVEPKGKAK